MDFLQEIDRTWTLFLDRDGVINHEKNEDYIRKVDEFVFYDNALLALKFLSKRFDKIIVVTNQRGIGKGLMTHEDLTSIHTFLKNEVEQFGGHIDAFYYAPELESEALNRKPNTGMAIAAKKDFPTIDFQKSIMVGNNLSDMEFGKRMGMKTVFLRTTKPEQTQHPNIDYFHPTLFDFAKNMI